MESSVVDFTPQYCDPKLITAAKENEQKLLELLGLKANIDVFFNDVLFDFYGTNYIHTVYAGEKNTTNMVIIHGYGGSSITFYRMLKRLSQKFRVFVVDLLGMGLSSRPKFTLKDSRQCVDFFVESLEKWRQASGVEQFHIVGHSLGGYLSGQYSIRYPQRVTKIWLISPAGINKEAGEFGTVEEFIQNQKCWVRRKFFQTIWKHKSTPQSAFKSFGFVGRKLLCSYVKKRFKRSKEESKLLYNYFLNTLNLPESSEQALHYLLRPPKASAFLQIEDQLASLTVPIRFFFGDKDWMEQRGAKRICENNPGRCTFRIVKAAGHHINMDNPDYLLDCILQEEIDSSLRVQQVDIVLEKPSSKNVEEKEGLIEIEEKMAKVGIVQLS